ncbi:MAG: hypothetical protein GC192_20140 [Bacteroidetes bacterium]|nr:hypothetical protein [Bacteroidota bacterium]
MAENQHNDNLERFFKANLEGYAPTPSDDFWSRMEPVIPPKPPYWSGWWSGAGRWVGLAILAIVAVLVLWFWHRDRSQIEKLKITVAQQEERLQALDATVQTNVPAPTTDENPAPITTTPAEKQTVVATSPQVEKARIFNSSIPVKKELKSEKSIVSKQTKGAQIEAKRTDLRKSFLTQHDNKQGIVASSQETIQQKSELIETKKLDSSMPSESHLNLESNLGIPVALASKNTTLINNTTRRLVVKPILVRPQIDYPKFSVEAGATAFRLPLGRLFQQDTFLTGRTGLSYGMGFKVNYELNSHTTLQAGYQFTNLRARRLALRYNSFPVAVVKRLAWGRRSHLEGKIGASVNSLVSARTDSDGQSVKGLKPTWVGVNAGVAATWSITENLIFVAGPNAGFSLTPITAGRRSWDIGVGTGLRYQL